MLFKTAEKQKCEIQIHIAKELEIALKWLDGKTLHGSEIKRNYQISFFSVLKWVLDDRVIRPNVHQIKILTKVK